MFPVYIVVWWKLTELSKIAVYTMLFNDIHDAQLFREKRENDGYLARTDIITKFY